MELATKLCTKCNTMLPVKAFWKNRAITDGLNGWCKKCVTERRRKINHPVSVDLKICTRCKVTKSAGDFHRNRLSSDGLHSWCKECTLLQAAWRQYGILDEDYQQLLNAQNGKCAICKATFERTPHIDHSHTTGKVRGLLCLKCNALLGCANDSQKILENAIQYLMKE